MDISVFLFVDLGLFRFFSGAKLKNPQLALAIVYRQKGQQKAVNVCAQTQFHFEMVKQALEKLTKMWRAKSYEDDGDDDDDEEQDRRARERATSSPVVERTNKDAKDEDGLTNLFGLCDPTEIEQSFYFFVVRIIL